MLILFLEKFSFSKNGKSSSQSHFTLLPSPAHLFLHPCPAPIIRIYHCVLVHLKYQGKSTYVNISNISPHISGAETLKQAIWSQTDHAGYLTGASLQGRLGCKNPPSCDFKSARLTEALFLRLRIYCQMEIESSLPRKGRSPQVIPWREWKEYMEASAGSCFYISSLSL